ncbi:MAG: gliding motility lipoprotein GldH [Flavipsychrobacter sp.]|nr:gliding motility lipoprotein GldH [Flavipsychrobacter sp.]
MNKLTTNLKRTAVAAIASSLLLLGGCIESPYFQKQESIPGYKWDYKYLPSFEFEITDTTHVYDVFFLMRHTEAYPYSNLWMNIYTRTPGDTTYSKQRVNVELAISGGKNNGQWKGRGMGEIWEHKLTIAKGAFEKKGKYSIKFEQNMRVNPLPEVLQVGLRVEKGNARTFKAQ